MTTRETLIEARRLIAEVGWTQGFYARTDTGTLIEFDSPLASCFCMVGALRRACGLPLKTCHLPATYRLLKAARLVDNNRSLQYLVDWNDKPGRTKEEVLAAFDKAIEGCKE